jgi:hypothetical protein
MESVEERMYELLVRWDELRRGGEPVSPEDLCSDCPELLEVLKNKIGALEALAPMLELEQPRSTTSPPEPWSASAVAAAGLVAHGPPGYEICSVIGHGSMGIVYRALDCKRGEVVALKTILRLVPSALYRFKREFRTLADLTHPNLVKLHELISDGRDWWITMEFVEGVDFLSHVRPAGELAPPGRLQDAFRQLARGVAALHAGDRLHRDLKPSNVRVTGSGRVVVLDFGLAAELNPEGRHRSTEPHMIGTVAYMAPEQADAQPIGPAADWYSFGVMMYQALAGRVPFSGSPHDVLVSKQTAKPPQLPAGLPGVAAELSALCMELLDSDPALRPAGAEVLGRLGDELPAAMDVAVSCAPRQQMTPLAGRRRHLEALDDAFATVREGQAVALLLRGHSGVGKTTLAHRFLDGLGAASAVILSGRCREQEWVPYKAIDGLIDALSRYLKLLPVPDARELLPRDVLSLARVFPVLHRVDAVFSAPGRAAAVSDPRELRRRAFAALRELLARIGDRRPLVLFIDDLQWGDVDSAELIDDVMRPPDSPSLLLLGSYRSEDRASSPFLQALLAPDRAFSCIDHRELDLEPLNLHEAEDLALELLGRETPAASDHARIIARESEGNPYFIHELARSAGRASLPPLTAGVLAEVLWSRIEQLPQAARRLLEVVAVSGRAMSWEDASKAAGLESGERTALAVLRSSRLLRGTGPQEDVQLEVYHDRVREVVVDRLAPTALREHHRRLAMQIEDSGRADVEDLAVHFHAAGEHERAGVLYAAAAERASKSLAFDRAVTLYRLALELRPTGSPDEYRLRARLGDALANARRGREAGQVYLDASPGVSRLESIELRRRAFQQLLTSGEHDKGLDVLQAVFRDVGLRYARTPAQAFWLTALDAIRIRVGGTRFRARPLGEIAEEDIARLDVGWSAGMGLCLIDMARAAQILFDNLLRSLRAGDVLHATQAMLAVSGFIAVRGRAGVGFSRRLMQSAEQQMVCLDDPTLVALHCMVKGLVALCHGDWSVALALNDRGAMIFRERCTGVATSLDISAYFSLLALFWLGDFDELRRRRRVLLEKAEERADLFSMTNYRTEVMSYDLLPAGDPDGAAHEVADAIGRWSQRGFHVQHLFALCANVRIDLYRGTGAQALARLGAARCPLRETGLDRSCITRVNIDQLIAASALAAWVERPGGTGLLREAAAAARRLDRERLTHASALASMFRGRLASIQGERDKAVACYQRAAETFRVFRMPLFQAATRFRLGEMLPMEEGASSTREATDWLASRQIPDPTSLIRMVLP